MKRFKNILLVCDPNTENRPALARAASLAHKNGGQLTVLEVIDDPLASGVIPPDRSISLEVLKNDLAERERKHIEGLISSYNVNANIRIIFGKPFLEIIREVLRSDRDLVVKSTEKNGDWLDRLFGSTDMHLLRKCPCPVWLVKPTEQNPYRCMLAAVDLGDPDSKGDETQNAFNRSIAELAGSMAFQESCALHYVYVWYSISAKVMQSERAGLKAEEVNGYIKTMRSRYRQQLDQFMRKVENWIGRGVYELIK